MEKVEMPIIARIHTPYKTKFGIPRQSGFADNMICEIVFEKEFRNEAALKGIEEFSHLWILWYFSDVNEAERWRPTVRPPKLGGNKRVGVFATRSPYRPSRIGLSCVKLEGVEKTNTHGVVLKVSGADMLDGTPVFDVKPYLPYADIKENAKGSFADEKSEIRLPVNVPENLAPSIPKDDLVAMTKLLALDPRPGYKSDGADKVYRFEYSCYKIEFYVHNGEVFVQNIIKQNG